MKNSILLIVSSLNILFLNSCKSEELSKYILISESYNDGNRWQEKLVVYDTTIVADFYSKSKRKFDFFYNKVIVVDSASFFTLYKILKTNSKNKSNINTLENFEERDCIAFGSDTSSKKSFHTFVLLEKKGIGLYSEEVISKLANIKNEKDRMAILNLFEGYLRISKSDTLK